MSKRVDYWEPGEKAELARIAGVPREVLSRVLHRKTGFSKIASFRYEEAARLMGLNIPYFDWLFSKTSTHPAFYGKPDKKELKKIQDASNLR